MRLAATTALVLALHPLAVRAQTPTPSLFRADTAASIGWFTVNHHEGDDCCANWSSSLFKGVGGGFYWNDHLKSELEFAWPGPTHAFTYSNSRTFADGSPVTYEEHTYRGVKISGSQLYQFGGNAMFHPFAGVGVDVDREHDSIIQTTQTGRAFTRIELTENELHTRPFVTTGFKAYFSERGFFRTEVKVGFSDRIEQVTWKSGLGIDFGKSSPRPRPVAATRAEAPRRQDPPELWRAYATKLPIGSTLRIAAGHERYAASLLAVDETGILVKPKSRVLEPPRHLSFDSLDEVELYADGTSVDRAGAIVAGIGSGAGTFLVLLLVLISQID